MPGGDAIQTVLAPDGRGVYALDPAVYLVEWQAASEGDGRGGGSAVFGASGDERAVAPRRKIRR